MVLPNFLLIGAQKAGTTALYHYLRQHPQIYMSRAKEPGFFAFEGSAPDFRGPGDHLLYRGCITDIKTYETLFQDVANEVAIGEATTWYLYSPEAPHRIKHYVPNIKLIAILRNPIDRAYSAFMHAIRDEREPLKDFATALQAEEQRIAQNWEYLWRYKDVGLYSAQVQRYFDCFERHQIQIYLHEDLETQPVALLQNIFQFLDVDQSYMPEVFTRLNTSGVIKNKALAAFLRETNPVKQFLRPLFPVKWRQQVANRLRTQNFQKFAMSQAVRQQLIEFYRPDILELQSLLQRDLTAWLQINSDAI